MKKETSVSVIFPAYKPENIVKTIRKYGEYLESRYRKLEIILLIDGVSKKEGEELRKKLKKTRVIVNEKRLGKGRAIRKGFEIAKNEIIGFVDVDESVSPKETERIIDSAIERGVAIGIRKPEQYKSVIRRSLSRVFNLYVWLATGLNTKDSQCGVKFFRKDEIEVIIRKMRIDGFAIDVEILYLLEEKGVRITEVLIDWKHAKESTVSFFSIIRMAFDIILIRFF